MDTETTPVLKKRRRGRPRKDDADRDVRRAEIVNAAIKLFAEQSYRETTMSDIARSIGLNQSSLYYWFKDKESLLEAILKDNAASQELASMLSMLPGEHPLHLYAVVYADTMMMCSYPFDYFELEDAALSHPDRFQPFFDTYRNLRQTVEQIIRNGVEEGDFPARVEPVSAAGIVLAMTEGLQHQYHQSISTAGDVLTDAWEGFVQRSAEEVAKLAADNVINALSGTADVDSLFSTAVDRGWITASQQ